jgi:hypothetical protein
LLFLLAPAVTHASDVTVDCVGLNPGTFATITAALASMTPSGPNSIFVTCSTTENVRITNFTGLFINATPGTATVTATDANHRPLVIFNSSNVAIDGLNFSGGRGVAINSSNNVQLGDGGISGSSGQGLNSFNSSVDLFGSSNTSLFTIQNSVRSGIVAQGGTLSLDGGVVVTNNSRLGIAMLTGHLLLNGGDGGVTTPDNIISNNGLTGVEVADTAECDAGGGNSILNNGSFGLLVIHTSTVIWGGGGTISGNQGVGVHIGETSHGEFDTVSITGNGAASTTGVGGMEVTDHSDTYIDGGVNASSNTGIGIQVNLSSLLNSLGGDTINNNTDDGVEVDVLSVVKFAANDTITGNGKFALHCGNGSLVVGDVSTYKPKKCGPAFQATPLN